MMVIMCILKYFIELIMIPCVQIETNVHLVKYRSLQLLLYYWACTISLVMFHSGKEIEGTVSPDSTLGHHLRRSA